jgi:hypothetical protein
LVSITSFFNFLFKYVPIIVNIQIYLL